MKRVRIERESGRARYHAYCAETGERLTSPQGQGSPEQAETAAERVLRRRARKKRKCMRCGKKFLSEGPGHRLCSERCRDPGGELGGEEYGALDRHALEKG
jgi:hypothetical protein